MVECWHQGRLRVARCDATTRARWLPSPLAAESSKTPLALSSCPPCPAGSARTFVASALAQCFYASQTNGVVATAGRDGPERALLQAIESRQVQVLGMVRNERFAEFIRLQMLAQPELRQCFVFGLGHFLDHAATCSGAFLRLLTLSDFGRGGTRRSLGSKPQSVAVCRERRGAAAERGPRPYRPLRPG